MLRMTLSEKTEVSEPEVKKTENECPKYLFFKNLLQCWSLAGPLYLGPAASKREGQSITRHPGGYPPSAGVWGRPTSAGV